MTCGLPHVSPSPPADDSESSARGAREARALAEIVQRINQSLELDRVFALIVRHAAELLGARGARLGILEHEEVVIAAACGDEEAVIGARIPAAEAFAEAQGRWVWRAGAAPPEEPRALTVPCLVGGRVIGSISIFGGAGREFDEHDERLLLALAGHAAVAIENARLYRASVRTMWQSSILASAARSLALNTTPETMYADIARIARGALGAEGIGIYHADVPSRMVEIAHSSGIAADVSPLAVDAFWDAAGGRALRSSTAVFRSDVTDTPQEGMARLLIERGVASAALIPLIVEGRPQGVLVLRFRERQRFETEQRQLLIDFATHVAIAVRNALLLQRAEQRAARLAAVAHVQQAISAAVSLAEVYAAIYRAVASVVDAPCFTLLGHDEREGVFVPEYVVNDGVPVDCTALPRLALGEGATTQAFRTATPNITARSDRGWTGQVHEVCGGDAIALILSAPIIHGEQVLGVLQAQSYRTDAYRWDDVDLIMLIARQAGTAIARARALEAERRSRQRERTLAMALECMDQPVFICSSAARVQYANGAAVCEYGYGLDELIGMHERQLSIVPAGVSRARRDEMHDAVRERGMWAGERLQRRRDGTEFPAWVTVNTIHDADGRVTASVVSVRNLSEERRVAEQLRQSEKLFALGELVAGVAHEVNNPLTGISAFAQLLQEDSLTPDQLEAAQMIKREADRAVAVIRDLLTFARKTGPRTVLVDLNELIEQTLRLRTYGLRTGNVQIELDLASPLDRVKGDDRQLQQVLLNIIVNAEHAMAGGVDRRLRVRTANEYGRVIVEIADNGAGMSPEVQKRIFEPFFTTKPEGKGTGLGLSVSYGIVQTHGGTLTVHSSPGAGATFRLSLPACADAGVPGAARISGVAP